MIDALQCGFALGFGVFCVVAGCGSALKVVQWVGKKLGVKEFDT
jgi:hypothetical protein